MASATIGTALRQIHRLFEEGAIAGLSDAQLLERFLNRRDGSAFEVLVGRHGPMVLGVCRGVLIDRSDTEDAFQATFLLLAQKAGGILARESLGAWLHRVAHRVAAQANADAARRKAKERLALTASQDDKKTDDVRDEAGAILHEEVNRLSEKYRKPLVLCDLQGQTHAQAALQLRCGEATIRRRLTTAREILRSRLTQRGVAPVIVLFAAGSADQALATPLTWMETAIRASLAPETGRAFATSLANRVGRAMLAGKVKVAMAALLLMSAGLGAAQIVQEAPNPQAMKLPPKAPPALAQEKTGELASQVELHGLVLDPEGKPFAGAKIYLTEGAKESDMVPPAAALRAASGPDGRFRFTATKDELRPTIGPAQPTMSALAKGFGPGWMRLDVQGLDREWTLRLSRDDIPIVGRVVNLEGKGVPGVRVSVNNLVMVPNDNVAAWVEKLKGNNGRIDPELWHEMRNRLFLGARGPLPATETDNQGRFHLTGIGRNRIAFLMAESPTITLAFGSAITTELLKDLPVPLPGQGEGKLHGPKLDLLVAPGRAVEGVVRDRNTKKPLAGVRVQAWHMNEGITDEQGRYRITGLPKQSELEIVARPVDLPYFTTTKAIGDAPGLAPITVDFELTRSVWVEGKVVDRISGKPVPAARVEYFPYRDNPYLAKAAGFTGLNNNISDDVQAITDSKGRFRIVALPGGGLVGVQTGKSGYLAAKPLDSLTAARVLHAANFEYQMHAYQGFASINPSEDAASVACEVLLEPGRIQTIKLVDPDNKPVAGSLIFGFEASTLPTEQAQATQVSLVHPSPGSLDSLTMIHESRHLGGMILLKGDEVTPLQVQLKPTGTIVGRLVDSEGTPLPNVELLAYFDETSRGRGISREHLHGRIETGPNGRFRLENLVEDVSYQLLVISKRGMRDANGYLLKARWKVQAGETRDWGDVREIPFRVE